MVTYGLWCGGVYRTIFCRLKFKWFACTSCAMQEGRFAYIKSPPLSAVIDRFVYIFRNWRGNNFRAFSEQVPSKVLRHIFFFFKSNYQYECLKVQKSNPKSSASFLPVVQTPCLRDRMLTYICTERRHRPAVSRDREYRDTSRPLIFNAPPAA